MSKGTEEVMTRRRRFEAYVRIVRACGASFVQLAKRRLDAGRKVTWHEYSWRSENENCKVIWW